MTQFSQMENHCSNLTASELATIHLTYTVTGAVCSVILLTITLLLVLCKQFDTLLKRLFLYVMLVSSLRQFSLTASYEHHFKHAKQEIACIWIAYIFDWAGIVLGVFMIGMMSYLFYLVCCLAKGKAMYTPRFLQSNCRRNVLEITYVVLFPALLFAYASIPYFNNTYGLTEHGQCWIKLHNENCTMTTSGLLDQFINGYILYFIHGIVGLLFAIAIVITYLCMSASLSEARLLIKKTLIVLSCLLVRILVIVVAFVNQMTARHQKVMALRFSLAILYPASLLLFPFAFLICFSKVHHIIKEKVTCCKCKKRSYVVLQPFAQSIQDPTVCVSTRISPPSDTFFTAPHTDGFTDLSYGSTAILVRGNSDTSGYSGSSNISK